MITPTDYFDRPLAIGDRVVYPVQRGSSAATLNEGVIVDFVELIPHPDNSVYFIREDQKGKLNPTTFTRTSALQKRPYIVKLSVKTWQDGKYMMRTVKNVALIVKGPA